MGSQGFRNIAGNPFVYQEDTRSAAFGLDAAAQKWKLSVKATAGALPTDTPQLMIDPATDGNIEIVPNGAGLLKIGSTSYPKTVAIGDVLVASASNTVGIVAGATTSGYVLTANGAGNAPTFQAAAAGGMTWNSVSGTTQSMTINNGYVPSNTAMTTITLPSTAAFGSTVAIAGYGAGGWKLAQNSGQIINFGTYPTTTGTSGALYSSASIDSVTLLCIVANTTWTVISAVGNIIVV